MAQNAWTVTLTAKQEQARAEMVQEEQVTAFAISPDGAWGRSWGFDDAALAAERSLAFCRAELRPRKRDCLVYEVGGKRVAPATVQTRKVSVVYKSFDGRKAASVFGRAPYDFAGNRSGALAQLATAPTRRGTLPEDKALRAALTNRTIMTTQSKGFALWFEGTRAEHAVSTSGGVLTVLFDSWTVTPEGLMCMFDGHWEGTGKPVGTRCVLLNAMGDGLVDLSWDQTPNATRKAQLIAGDARFAAVK